MRIWRCLQPQAAGPLGLEQHGGTRAGIEGEAQGRAVVDANSDDEMTVVPLERNVNTFIACVPDMLRLGIATLQVLEGPGRAGLRIRN